MTQENILIPYSEFSVLKKYFVKLNEENLQLQHELLSVKEGLNKISGAVIRLEKYVTDLEEDLTKTQKRITKVVKYLDRKEADMTTPLRKEGSDESQPSPPVSPQSQKEPPSEPAVTEVEERGEAAPAPSSGEMAPVTQSYVENAATVVEISNDKTRKREAESVMIFISPEVDTAKDGDSDSTRESRRQLMPTMEEEKVLLGYLQDEETVITQKEYERLLKVISEMLISAPKNAIAIEVKKIDTGSQRKTLEFCYHIQVKGMLTRANFNYFEYKGKESRN